MNSFVLEIWNDECKKCIFYTVRWVDAEMNETDKFLKKHYAIEEYRKATQELVSFILDSVGEDHGAIDVLFNRFENEVVGLPNRGKVTVGEISFFFSNFPLRLYALRINDRDDAVVLFNGGIKSGQTNRQSRDLNLKWMEACQFAKRIEEALRNKELVIDRKGRLSMEGESEIIL
jgi:hypothetical protein